MKTIRAFIAFHVPPDVKALLAQVQEQLAHPGLKVTWVRPEAMHLTLKFLGDTPEEQTPAIIAAMREAGAAVRPFTLHLIELGGFPNLNYPRVLWAGWKDESGMLNVLRENLEERLAALGITRDARAFTPHLTLGRVKSVQRRGPLLRQAHAAQQKAHAEAPVDAFSLMRSELNPGGAIHTVLETVKLGN